MCYQEECKHGIYCGCQECESFVEKDFEDRLEDSEIDEREKNNKD